MAIFVFLFLVYVCALVYVCERERGREREKKRDTKQGVPVWLSVEGRCRSQGRGTAGFPGLDVVEERDLRNDLPLQLGGNTSVPLTLGRRPGRREFTC